MNPYLAARLLSKKNELSVLEKEEILAKVMNHPSVTGKSRRSHGVLVSVNKLPIWARATAAAAAMFLIVVAPSYVKHSSEEQSTLSVRWMGEQAAVETFLQRDGKTSRLDGQRPSPGDHIRFRVTLPSGKTGYASVVAIEGQEVIPLIPSEHTDPAIPVEEATLLPGSVKIIPGDDPVALLLVFRATEYVQKDLMTEILDNLPWKPGKNGVDGVVLELPIDPQPQVKK